MNDTSPLPEKKVKAIEKNKSMGNTAEFMVFSKKRDLQDAAKLSPTPTQSRTANGKPRLALLSIASAESH